MHWGEFGWGRQPPGALVTGMEAGGGAGHALTHGTFSICCSGPHQRALVYFVHSPPEAPVLYNPQVGSAAERSSVHLAGPSTGGRHSDSPTGFFLCMCLLSKGPTRRHCVGSAPLCIYAGLHSTVAAALLCMTKRDYLDHVTCARAAFPGLCFHDASDGSTLFSVTQSSWS